uniref:Uncharacterized protein n=1 Tax=Anopheles darlingi TaxID=43151 RepID=A0A2M4DLK8_ANODA
MVLMPLGGVVFPGVFFFLVTNATSHYGGMMPTCFFLFLFLFFLLSVSQTDYTLPPLSERKHRKRNVC